MKPFRTAILGCGHFAKRHAAILTTLQQVQLVAFCDSTIENAAAYNQQYANGEAKVYSDSQRLFAEMGLDLVYICLPPYAHSDEVALACQHGVHFLIEKPIALSTSLAVEMAQQVKASGVKNQVGFMYRFGEAAQWLKANAPSNRRCLHDRPLCLQFASQLVVARPLQERRPTGRAGNPFAGSDALLLW